jgi:hypothetical protein
MGHGSKRRRKTCGATGNAGRPVQPRPRRHTAGLKPRRRLAPDLAALTLERRELLTITDFHAAIAPQILFPPNGESLPVFVTGSYRVGTKHNPAQANFQVVDEYRLVQPQGNVKSRAVPNKPGVFAFSFKTYLQARVASSDSNGRLYTMVVAVTETNDSAGRTFGIWVPPAGFHPPKSVPHAKTAARLSSRGRMR